VPVVTQAFLAVLALAMVSAGVRVELPPVPPLPSSGFPKTSSVEPFARELVARIPPAQLEARLIAEPELIPPVLRNLGSALMTADGKLRGALEPYLIALANEHARRVAPRFSKNDLRILVSLQVVDPIRFQQDSDFRARVTALLPRMLDPSVPAIVRERCLDELNATVGIDFDTAEATAVAWGLAPRASGTRRIAYDAKKLRMPDDVSEPIVASIFSIQSQYFTPVEARAFLSAVRAASPKRRIVVLGDAEIRAATEGLEIDFIDAHLREYSPWPRDPFIMAHATDGVVLVNRPNLQPEREEDANMARALVQGLPDSIASNVRWTVAPVPFHNGHVLLTPAAAWISIHTVEIRALQILGVTRVPVASFETAEGVERYLGAVRKAAKELESVYGRPVRFVHPLQASPDLMWRLGGGAGFDLDSLVTILPKGALVGDLTLGTKVARSADWSAAQAAYGLLTKDGAKIADGQRTPDNLALQTFLDTVAAHLAANGFAVRRLPLINVPASLVENGRGDFLLTWNNVVLEGKRAEGFASLLAAGDDLAKTAFAESGHRLELYPPLSRSVVLSGGYRCASNHLRQ
jgi:hypothetical protein